jgi:hypothetical protein
VSELAGLYSRYKGLALAVGAGLILDADGETGSLGAETLRLAADAGRARETHDAHAGATAARACHQAALDLHRLATAAPGAPDHAALIAQVRASHKALRALLWDDIAHQYAPCGADPHPRRHAPAGAHPHRHTQEHDHV